MDDSSDNNDSSIDSDDREMQSIDLGKFEYQVDISKLANIVNNSTLSTSLSTTPPSHSFWNTGNVTVSNGGSGYSAGSYLTSNGSNGTSWTTYSASAIPQPELKVTGNANIEGELFVKGKDIAKSLETIEKRLAILVPDPKKLEHFEALKKAYEHYKVLEALCELPVEKDE